MKISLSVPVILHAYPLILQILHILYAKVLQKMYDFFLNKRMLQIFFKEISIKIVN